MKLKINNKAPTFKALDQFGKTIELSGYKGKWVLLYFYPKDFTPGCTREACSFRDSFGRLRSKVEIVGISGDSVDSHKKFSGKYNLPFTLLEDSGKKIFNSYKISNSPFQRRFSYLIDPKGIIKKIYTKVNPGKHPLEVLKDLRILQSSSA